MSTQISPPTDTANPSLPANRGADKTRLADYTSNLAFYNGAQYPGARQNSRLRRLTFNYTRAIVKKVASYVMTGFSVGVEPRDPSRVAAEDAAAAEQAWHEIALNNGLTRIDMATEIDCAVLGDAAYKITWDKDLARVAVVAVDVAGLNVWPHPFDPLRFYRVAQRYVLTKDQLAQFWGLPIIGAKATVTEDWTDDTLRVWIDNGTAPAIEAPNPYGFTPFVIYPNEQVPKQWNGESDLVAFIEAAKEFNAEYSRLSSLMELSGNPITVLSGVDESKGLETFPGAIWEMPEGAQAHVLDLLAHGAAAAHIEYLQALQRAIHDLAETPRTAFGDNTRSLSGVALQVELQPLLQKVERKRAIRADAHAARTGMAFAINDQFAGTNLLAAGRIQVAWAPPTPSDRTREITDEVTMVTAQITSRAKAMLRLGESDPDGELTRITQETDQLATPAATPPPR